MWKELENCDLEVLQLCGYRLVCSSLVGFDDASTITLPSCPRALALSWRDVGGEGSALTAREISVWGKGQGEGRVSMTVVVEEDNTSGLAVRYRSWGGEGDMKVEAGEVFEEVRAPSELEMLAAQVVSDDGVEDQSEPNP